MKLHVLFTDDNYRQLIFVETNIVLPQKQRLVTIELTEEQTNQLSSNTLGFSRGEHVMENRQVISLEG